ncbi:hydroxyacid dehydrogenase [Saccharothrix deserti]|uniref:hydroxyacid dehydrogenase n=1 Tax=Saccharothrix deserti TaxID=2593674 RepID=UPI00131D0052|nr:hydroxyacid dehydrogenase [Saccharothrix deserti]
MANRPTALFAMSREHLPMIFPEHVMSQLRRLVEVDETLVAERFDTPEAVAALADVEVLVTGWGCPPIDAAVLRAAPRLRAVLHTAGSVKTLITPECWERGVVVSSAADANALPVAELTLAMILLAGKDVLGLRERYRTERHFTLGEVVPDIGNFRRRVGIVGASRIGRRVVGLLEPFDLIVSLTDPYLTAPLPGVRLVELDELLRDSDVVSLHAPATPETHHMLDKRRLALIPDGGVLINTARGSLVDTDALIDELSTGRISAVLDVTEPEPLPSDSPLFDLPNVFATPHIAGSHGNELGRLGQSAVDDLERLIAGVPLHGQVLPTDLDRVA